MATFTSSGGQLNASVTVAGVTNPEVTNVAMLLANTEYVINLPANCRRYLIKLRDLEDLKLRYVSGSDFLTVPRGCHYTEDDLGNTSLVLYVETTSASQVLELVTWV